MRTKLLGNPGLAYLLMFALIAALAWAVTQSHQAINQSEPEEASARSWMMFAHVLAAGSAFLLVLIAGRNAFFLLPPALLGALHLYDVFEQYLRFGLDAELGMVLTLIAVAHAMLAGLGMWGMARVGSLRSYASWVPLAFLAAWAGAFLIIGPSLLAGLNEYAQDIESNWTNEHADPAPAFWVGAVALVAIVGWLRRRR